MSTAWLEGINMTEKRLDVSPTSRAFTSALRQRQTRTVDTTLRRSAFFVGCLLVPGLPCPRNLGEERVDGPEVPGGLVAADAVAGTGHHDGPDQVVVHRLLPGPL
jgi:hypothetical protein